MAQFPQIEIKHNIGNTIKVPTQLDVKIKTFTSDVSPIGTMTLDVDNAIDFSSGSDILLLLSGLTAENAEIVTSSAHADLAFTIAATHQLHNRGESVQEIKYDQVSVFKSSTIGGSYTLLVTQTFQVVQMNTIMYDPAGLTTDYYKVQWMNSISGDVSDFSDPISVLAYPPNSAGKMFASITKLFGISENDKIITPDFLLTALNDARQYTKSELSGIRHAWQQVFEFPIKVLAGSNYILLPDNIEYDETDQSVLAVRFVTNNILVPFNLTKIDKRSWNQITFYSIGGITQADVAIAATTIPVNSVGDFFPQGGSAQVATTDFTQTVMQITYTGIDYDTNELTGVSGVTRLIPEGTQVWAQMSSNQPIYYSVWEGKIWFTSVIPQSMQGNNCYVDYYKRMEEIMNLYDEIPEKYRELYKPYLRWAIKYRKDITTPTDDPDLVKFEKLVVALFNNLYTGQDSVIITS